METIQTDLNMSMWIWHWCIRNNKQIQDISNCHCCVQFVVGWCDVTFVKKRDNRFRVISFHQGTILSLHFIPSFKNFILLCSHHNRFFNVICKTNHLVITDVTIYQSVYPLINPFVPLINCIQNCSLEQFLDINEQFSGVMFMTAVKCNGFFFPRFNNEL